MKYGSNPTSWAYFDGRQFGRPEEAGQPVCLLSPRLLWREATDRHRIRPAAALPFAHPIAHPTVAASRTSAPGSHPTVTHLQPRHVLTMTSKELLGLRAEN